jgi:hypothetical protein
MIFSGRPRTAAAGRDEKDALFQDLIRQATIAFWDAYLMGDTRAKSWLSGGGLKSLLRDDGTLETKRVGVVKRTVPGR